MFRRACVFVSVALAAAACSSSASSPPAAAGDGGASHDVNGTTPPPGAPACGEAGRTGETDCKDRGTTCPTGTYCTTDIGEPCPLGCTSDRNCAANQRCVIASGDRVGACQACDAVATNSCAPSAADDARCLAPGKAYRCQKESDAPSVPGTTCKAVTDAAGLYCCGGEPNPCERNSPEDPLCDGKKAYDCPPNADAPSGCTSSHGAPTTVCCSF